MDGQNKGGRNNKAVDPTVKCSLSIRQSRLQTLETIKPPGWSLSYLVDQLVSMSLGMTYDSGLDYLFGSVTEAIVEPVEPLKPVLMMSMPSQSLEAVEKPSELSDDKREEINKLIEEHGEDKARDILIKRMTSKKTA